MCFQLNLQRTCSHPLSTVVFLAFEVDNQNLTKKKGNFGLHFYENTEKLEENS
jgi:hypothetical protein